MQRTPQKRQNKINKKKKKNATRGCCRSALIAERCVALSCVSTTGCSGRACSIQVRFSRKILSSFRRSQPFPRLFCRRLAVVCKAVSIFAKSQLLFWLPWLERNRDAFIARRCANLRSNVARVVRQFYVLVPECILRVGGPLAVVQSKLFRGFVAQTSPQWQTILRKGFVLEGYFKFNREHLPFLESSYVLYKCRSNSAADPAFVELRFPSKLIHYIFQSGVRFEGVLGPELKGRLIAKNGYLEVSEIVLSRELRDAIKAERRLKKLPQAFQCNAYTASGSFIASGDLKYDGDFLFFGSGEEFRVIKQTRTECMLKNAVLSNSEGVEY